MVDRLRLQQVVLNLTRNSIKFVDQGFIRLRAWEHSDGYICLAIEDSGPGIPMEKRQNLFNRFQSSLDSLAQGTGVGLNLCKSLVEAMGGGIYLDNSYSSGVEGCPGARFVTALKATPVLGRNSSEDDNHQSFTSLTTEEPSLYNVLPEHLSVLFVDDERILRKLAIRAIGKLRPNWTVREAATGEAALALIETESFDLIFMDMYFTSTERQLTGIETVRAMRAKGVTCCICGLSANNLEGPFHNAGASSFLTKPFPAKQDDLSPFLQSLLHPSGQQ
jgi:CheY-like chemotaxis protein